MQLPRKTDQIYQLSLTEIAFILIFLLLLLLGWMIIKTEKEKEDALKQRNYALAKAAEISHDLGVLNEIQMERKQLQQALGEVRQVLTEKEIQNPDEILSELVKNAEVKRQNERLRMKVEDLNAQLTALQEIKDVMGKAVKQLGDQSIPGREQIVPYDEAAVKKEIFSALTFKSKIEKESNEKIDYRKEKEKALQYVNAMREFNKQRENKADLQELKKENQDLRAQLIWLQRKLNARGGRDYPPCWAEEQTGKPQYLFTVEIMENGFKIEPAWPSEREQDARRLPMIERLIAAEIQPIPAFKKRVQPLYLESKKKNCRHYVRLINRVEDLEKFNQHRYTIEAVFYKYEVR